MVGGKNGKYFKCALCGHEWKLDEVVRWVYTNDMKDAGGNPFVCVDCDGDDVRERWAKMCQEWREIKKKFWYFYIRWTF